MPVFLHLSFRTEQPGTPDSMWRPAKCTRVNELSAGLLRGSTQGLEVPG